MKMGLEIAESNKKDSPSETLKADTIANEALSEEILLSKTSKELRQIAITRKIGTGGSKVELITRIMAHIKEVPASVDKGILEEALMMWKQPVQKGYLARVNQPVSGTKTVLAQRIMNCIPIDEAVKVVQEYRIWMDTKETPEDMEVDEGETNNKEDANMEGTQSDTEDEEKLQKRVERLRD